MPYKQLGLICAADFLPELVAFVRRLGFDVCAVWSPNPDVGIQCATEFEIPFVASKPDEILLRKEVQMVVITGKPAIHSQICVKALGIGKHVLCDAPVGLGAPETKKMVHCSDYYPQILSLVGYGLRQLSVFREMKRLLLLERYVGEVFAVEATVHCSPLYTRESFDWRWDFGMGGGVLNLVGSHVIDLVAFLLGTRAERAQGLVKTHVSTLPNGFRRLNADNFASFLLKLAGGRVSASVHAQLHSPRSLPV